MMAKLELPLPTGFLQSELQRAIDLVSFGLMAAENATMSELSIPGVRSHVTPAADKALGVEDARSEFQSWILANGIRDCVEAVGPTLEWARKFCFLWTQPGDVTIKEDGSMRLGAKIKGEDWNTEIVEGARKFDFMGLPNKLNHLKQKYDFDLPALSQYILTLNSARNCLSHRRGIVGHEDVNDPAASVFEIKWRRLEFRVKKNGKEEILELPAHIEGGSLLSMAYVDASKQFQLGTKITITPDEFVEMAMTFLLFSLQMQESIKQMEERRRPESQRE
jgi:hypothetical protein